MRIGLDSRPAMHDIIRPTNPYVQSFEPVSKEDLNKIRCHFYINLGITEVDLKQFEMFLALRSKPQVFSTSRSGSQTFHTSFFGEEVAVDWRVYCTWANTFHLRFEEGLTTLGVKHSNPHVHPDNQHLLANWMNTNSKSPKPLAECDFSKHKTAA